MRGLGITLTRFGLKATLLLLVFVFAFLATPYSNPFFALIAWCCVTEVLGACWALRNLAGLTVAHCAARPAPAHSPRALRIELRGGRRRRREIGIAVEVDGEWRQVAYCNLVDGSVIAQATLTGLPRGIREVRRCRLESRWPFGLFRVRRTLPVAAEIVTWPEPAAPAGTAIGAAELVASRGGAPIGVRPFRSGDAIADVHWKASARRGAPVVRERAGGDTFEVVVDRRCDPKELEQRLSVASAQVLAAAAAERPVRLRSHDFVADTGAGHSTADLQRWLAAADALPTPTVRPT